MSDYKVINLDYLNDLALGSVEFKVEMISSFLESTPKNIETMKSSLAENNYELVGGIAHKLKTSFSFMGMDNMVTLAKQMQDDGLAGTNVETLGPGIDTMESTFNAAKVELQSELNNLQNG